MKEIRIRDTRFADPLVKTLHVYTLPASHVIAPILSAVKVGQKKSSLTVPIAIISFSIFLLINTPDKCYHAVRYVK